MDNDTPTPADTLYTAQVPAPSHSLPCRFDIGDPVEIRLQGAVIQGHVRAATFTAGKVRFAVRVAIDDDPTNTTTLHNLDSAILEHRPDGCKVTFDFDNYS